MASDLKEIIKRISDFLNNKDHNSIQPLVNNSNENIFTDKEDGIKFSSSKKWLLFCVFLGLMILERIITLIHFGFIYTDVDQVMLWNGAMDYSKGIFHEPFFYGQNYNYMLEALIAVPLLWMNIPVYIALPVVTSVLSVLPFIVLALFFFKKESYFWAFLCLAFPVLLPLPYNFLTTIPRGFVQAHFFVPLLFIPLFNPQSKKSVTILYIASAICIIANQSSLLIVVPIALYVYSYHYKSLSFYLKSLLVIPFFVADYFAKYFYVIHPEYTLTILAPLKPNMDTFLASLKNLNLFENLFPFFSGWGIVYPILFLIFAMVALKRSMKKEFLFILSIPVLLLITFAIPKVQERYSIPNPGIFFSSARLYLYLPVLFIITSYFIFHKLIRRSISVYILLLLCITMSLIKIVTIQRSVQETISNTVFPVAKNTDLISRANELKHITEKYHLDLIVHTMTNNWNNYFDSYTYYPLISGLNPEKEKTISVYVNSDRRSWLYPNSEHSKQILLNGFNIDDSLLKAFDYEVLNQQQVIIKNNTLNVTELFAKLNITLGNSQP